MAWPGDNYRGPSQTTNPAALGVRQLSFTAANYRSQSHLVPLSFHSIPVTGDSALGARSGSADTTWMPHPRRWNDMNAASMSLEPPAQNLFARAKNATYREYQYGGPLKGGQDGWLVCDAAAEHVG